MFNLKDRLYNNIVRGNENVCYEYERYVQEHTVEHYENRLRHWKILSKLCWHYYVKKENTPLLYFVPQKEQDIKNAPLTVNVPNTAKKQKLPYLEGAESRLCNNKEAHYIAKDCMQYEVISFDIFDTLILRSFAKPQDLFYIVGEKLGIDSFRKIRMKAEEEARELAILTKGNKEVTIYDIYELVNKYTGVPVEKGVEVEFETEMNLCFPNPQMKRVFDLLKWQGKRIILISDMYLTSDMISKLLDKCGISGYEKIFMSCEYQCNKRSGGLYLNVQRYLGKGVKFVHIGDNHETDFVKPKEYGIDSVFYKNVNKAGNMYRADGMSELVGSAYAGLVNAQLHNGIKKYSPHYEYGFVYGGLYVFGFCSWINNYSKQHGVDKVIFLSRDGSIYKKVFDTYFGDVSSEYMYWSRVANMKHSSDKQNGKFYFMTRVVDDRVNSALQRECVTISELLRLLHIEELEPMLSKERLKGDMLLTEDLAKSFKLFIHHQWDKIVEIYSRDEEEIKGIIQKKLADCKRVAVVDVGWNGSGPLGIKYLIEKKWKMDCKVDALLAGSKVADDVANIGRLQNRDLEVYMFSRMLNRDNYEFHKTANGGLNSSLFEIFTQACEPSFSFVKKGGKYSFEIPEIENYEMIREIQKGILDFCELYYNAFRNYEYMYNISGYDAYCPFRMGVRDTKLVKSIMSDFVFARNVGNSEESYGFLRAKDMFKKINL